MKFAPLDLDKYNPKEIHYFSYPSNIVSMLFQIQGVFETIGYARSNLLYLELDNYGELISKKDTIHLAFIKKKFIQDALIYYNIAVDLSWQVLWLYIEEDTLNLIYNEKHLNKVLRNCTYKNLLSKLEDKSLNNLIKECTEFFNYLKQNKVREKYNYLKHSGIYHFPEFGSNRNSMEIVLNGVNLKMLNRPEIDIDEWTKMLLEFDNSFIQYFERLIDLVVPKDFSSLKKINFLAPEYAIKGHSYAARVKNFKNT